MTTKTAAGGKTGATRRTGSKTVPKTAVSPEVATLPEPVAAPSMPELKRQELLAQVVHRSDVKKKFAKPVLDAALELIGAALSEGRDLNLAPLGKVKVTKVREQAGARVLVARIRQVSTRAGQSPSEDDPKVKETVAEPQE